jgi:WD40 repeat protein
VLREDGTRLGPYKGLFSFAYSPDGKRYGVAFTATGEPTEVSFSLSDGGNFGPYPIAQDPQGTAYNPSVSFSANGKGWYALVPRDESGFAAIVNGKEVTRGVADFWLSPSGAAWAGVAGKWGDCSLVWSDGKRYGPYNWVDDVVFSPSGDSWVSAVRDKNDARLVLTSDGRSLNPFVEKSGGSVVVRYSPDGKTWLITNGSEFAVNGALIPRPTDKADTVTDLAYTTDGKDFLFVGHSSKGTPNDGGSYSLFTSGGVEYYGIYPTALTCVTMKEKDKTSRCFSWFSIVNKSMVLNSLFIDP